jgi:outer membrane cobalamin receptor
MSLAKSAALIAALAGALAADAGAQTPRLHESVVVSGAVEPVPFETVARAVWVLTRADIARLPVRSIDDLLRFAASVEVRARGARLQSDFSIRGGSFGQTLVLLDGVRMNDAQSGHHNSDVPLTLDDIERVEVLMGAGSSLFGADAFGGTVNIITREASGTATAHAYAGEHGLGGGRVSVAMGAGAIRQAFSLDAARSSGFEYDRDFDTIAATSRTAFGRHTRALVGVVAKDFGANGFYGPAPSRETTDQVVAALTHGFAVGGWRASAQGMYRTHGDRFLYDQRQAAAVANEHRTQALSFVVRGSRALGSRTVANAGVETGGDWIRSNNLGDHSFGRGSAFVELQQRVGTRLVLQPGLRYDRYSSFGDATDGTNATSSGAWSPSAAARLILNRGVSLRGSAGHAFRVPTFTELYYRDPNHQAQSTLTPERGWSAEAGADWIPATHFMARGTLFVRRDRDVIDWIRPTTAERWRTTNVRRVATSGVELGVRELIGTAGWIDLQYTHLRTSATALAGMLSKYVLDYAPHNAAISGAVRVPLELDLSMRFGWTRRYDGRAYEVLDLRVSRPFGRATLFVDAANLFDERYQEVVGVAMPGRWMSAGLRFDLRRPSAKMGAGNVREEMGDVRDALSGIIHRADAAGADAARRQGAAHGGRR